MNGKVYIGLITLGVSLISMLLGFAASFTLTKDRAMQVDDLKRQIQELREDVRVLKVQVDYMNHQLEKMEKVLLGLDGASDYKIRYESQPKGWVILEKNKQEVP